MVVALGFDNPVFSQFVCYSILLILETIGIALLVIRIRVKRKVCKLFLLPSNLKCTNYIMTYIFNLLLPLV